MKNAKIQLPRQYFFIIIFLNLIPVFSYAAVPICLDCKKIHPYLNLTLGAATAKLDTSNQFVVGESNFNYQSHEQYTTSFLQGIGVGAEYQYDPCWSVQAGLGYYQPRSYSEKGTVTQGVDPASSAQFPYSYQVLSRQLVVEGKLLANVYEIYHPYGGLGLGITNNTAYAYNVFINPSFITMSPQYSTKTTTSFTYYLGAGIDVDIDQLKHFRLGVGYRFTDLGKASLGSGLLNQTAISNTLSQSNLYANEFFAQLTFIV